MAILKVECPDGKIRAVEVHDEMYNRFLLLLENFADEVKLCPECGEPMQEKGAFGYTRDYPDGVDITWWQCECGYSEND